MAGIVETGDGLLGTEERPAASAEIPAETSIKTMGDDQLTEAELAYFKSGGQDITGLLGDERYKADAEARVATEASAPATLAPPAAPAAPAATATPPAAEETVPDGEEVDFAKVTTGEDGRMRDERGRFVPHAALAKERERMKAQRDRADGLVEENRTLADNYTRLAERVKVLQELWDKPKDAAPAAVETPPEPVAPPDPETDIFAYARWQGEQIKAANEQIKALSQKVEEKTTGVEQKITERDMVSAYQADAARFAGEKTDFGKAYTHMITQRHAALAMLGYNDATERATIITGEERDLVERAFKAGKRPAEFIYNYAATMGYVPPAPTPTPPAPAAAAPAAAAPAPAPAAAPTAPVQSEAEKLLNHQRAQAATQTLSGTGGASGEGLTAESLAAMSDEQFAALHAQLGKKGMKAYLGGSV